MFDIISFIREKILRRPKLIAPIVGEEISEKQTTKLGYFLLYCMFGAILASAQWTLSIIEEIPELPTSIPSCVMNMVNTFDSKGNYYNSYYGNSYNDCTLTATHPKFDFTTEYNSLLTPLNDINNYRSEIQNLESQKQQAQYNQRNSQQDYNTSLAEKTAQENSGLYDTQEIQKGIQDSRSEISVIESQIAQGKNKIVGIESQYSPEIKALHAKITSAENDYKNAYLLYKFYIAILSFIFALVVFITLYKVYTKYKIKNSPHSIIFSVATFAYGLVLLQISLLFIWDIIPHKMLEWISNLFSIFTPLVYLVQFLWPILIVAIFGYAVYRIQKRLYSPQNILKRFITDKKCPGCGNAVDFTKPFCPLCSHEIQVHCANCHEITLKGMPYCSNCGTKLPQKDMITHVGNSTLDESLKNELSNIDISLYSGIKFASKDGSSFTLHRENIVKLGIYMTKKLGKTSFEPNEFAPYLAQILKHIKEDSITEIELKRIVGKITSWVECGGEVIFLKK